jgi:DNA-binding NtrC family response regulator
MTQLLNRPHLLTTDGLDRMRKEFLADPTAKLLQNALTTTELKAVALDHDLVMTTDTTVSHRLDDWKVTNQKQSGRCWLFAGLNLLRVGAAQRLNLKEFEFSENYAMFFDKIEKANFFLQAVVDTADRPSDDRTVATLLQDCVNDGGQWTMFAALIRKHGVVPKQFMPETVSSEGTRQMNGSLKAILRTAACDIRDAAPDAREEIVERTLSTVWRALCLHLGTPPERFFWQWTDHEKGFHRDGWLTPQEFQFGLTPGSRDSQTPQKRKARILVVDDDPGLLRLLTIRLRAENYEVEAVESAAAALAACVRFRPDLVITDLRMDQMDGIGLLKELQSRWPGLRVIILTAHGTIPDAVHATQSGAFGFLTKPVDKQDLLDHVQKALKVSGFAHVDEDWRANIITRNQLMEDKLAQANMVAGTDARVLLTGESGTGKELLARAIHEASPRRNKPFVSVNCSAMAENLLESELFGHERGAFAGATRAQKGLFETAEGGTLLLDEVGDMPMRLQVKLLRVLQENQIRPVGGAEPVSTNVRIISATHRDLHELMISGQFREDLYYRLNVVHIEMPALGRRREDIPLLVAHFLEQIAKETGHRKI